MEPCIYCGEPADSEEDWLPRGFGAFRGMTLLKNRLCIRCNNRLGGELDAELLNTGLTGTVRSILQIKGRHKAASKDPFLYRALATEAPTSLMLPCDHGDYEILGHVQQDEKGQAVATALRQLVFRRPGGEFVPVQFPPAYDAGRLRELIKLRGLADAELHEVYLDAHENLESVQDNLRALLLSAGLRFAEFTVYGGNGESDGRQDVRMSHGLSGRYLRALAKIGFHYYLWSTRAHTGRELMFHPIRRYIADGDLDHSAFVDPAGPHFIEALQDGRAPKFFTHFLGVGKVAGQITAAVQFFVGPEHITPAAHVKLAVTGGFVERSCHCVIHYGDKIDNFDGELQDVTEP